MPSIIGIYDSHEKAVAAIKYLQTAGYPVKQVSLMGKGEIVNGEARIKSVSTVVVDEIGIGAVLGSILGVLTGVGVFAVPGLGLLFGAGALFSGLAGFETGVLSGGIVGILTSIGIDITGAARYQQNLNEGKFMIIIQGNDKELDLAKKILETHGDHFEVNKHG